ncbi:MAG: ParB/RepB/Spo0J family partition protein [Bacteroidales bacterium]|nr:ParB/RepB/Spo0J family partition protein [Bacteroidales bacterium]
MATPKKSALGRGLDALIMMEEVKTGGSSSINEIELSKITANPDQPRREFDPIALSELSASIKELGIIQPITLREVGRDQYQIIAGERRYRASLLAGLEAIPAYVRTSNDEDVLEMALIENIQREDLNAIEIALAYQNLIEQYSLTQERLSTRIGKNRTTIANFLRLLKLPAEIQMGLKDKKIDMGHARALIPVENPTIQLKIYEEILLNELSVRRVEEMVKAINSGKSIADFVKTQTKKDSIPQEYAILKKHLSKFFKSKVQFVINDKGKGKISIPFKSEEELERIITIFDGLK